MQFLGLEILSRERRETVIGDILNEKYWKPSGIMTGSGVVVNADNALKVAAVYACVRVISETLASLPFVLYRKTDGNSRERATDDPLYRIFNARPNSYMTRFEFIELMLWHLLLRGNFYALIVKNARNQVKQLVPLNPDRVSIRWNEDRTYLVYRVTDDKGKPQDYDADRILHVRGHTDDGICGKGPIQVARERIGGALAIDQYSDASFANGVQLTGVLEHPEQLDDETSKRISDSFQKAYGGPKNAGKIAVLEEGMKFSQISMTNKDAEFVASKENSVTEIARIFRVPPHMIADLRRATFSNIEHQSIDFVVHTIRPWAVRIEQACSRAFELEDRGDFFVEFLLDALLRGDLKSRFDAYNVAINNGMMKWNEVREKENMNPLPWGDATLIPLNSRPISSKEDLAKEPAASSSSTANEPTTSPTDSSNDSPADGGSDGNSQMGDGQDG